MVSDLPIQFVAFREKITSLQSETQLFVSKLKSQFTEKNPTATLSELGKKMEKIKGDILKSSTEKLPDAQKKLLIKWLDRIHQMIDYQSQPSAIKIKVYVKLNALENQLEKGNKKQIGDLFGSRRYKTWHDTHELQEMRKELLAIKEQVADIELLRKTSGLLVLIETLLSERGVLIEKDKSQIQESKHPKEEKKRDFSQHYYPEKLPKDVTDKILTSLYQTNDMKEFIKFFLVTYSIHFIPEDRAPSLLKDLQTEASKEDLEHIRVMKSKGYSEKEIVYEMFSKLWESTVHSSRDSRMVAEAYSKFGVFTVEHYKHLKSTLNKFHLKDSAALKDLNSIEESLRAINAKESLTQKDMDTFSKASKALKHIIADQELDFAVRYKACGLIQQIYGALHDPRSRKSSGDLHRGAQIIKLEHKMDMFERVKPPPDYSPLKASAVIENALAALEKEIQVVGLQKAPKGQSLHDLIKLNEEMRRKIEMYWPILAKLPEDAQYELREKVAEVRQRLEDLGFNLS